MPYWNELMFQDAATPNMIMMISFHDLILVIMTLIMTIVSTMMLSLMFNKYTYRMGKVAHKIETIWTLIPGILLLVIAIPSLNLLYIMDEMHNPTMTVKVTGHQWYWSYEYSEFPNIKFDSFMINDSDLKLGDYRLLEVDNRLVLPINIGTRLLVTAADVIHSWTIPAMGTKVDAIPGRLNQIYLYPNRIGVFYGQCSEICGANHSFMPIACEVINEDKFINWAKSY